MRSVSQKQVLDEEIERLQNKKAQDLLALKEQFKTAYDSIRPINLIKSTFKEVISSPDIKSNILNNAVGFATGYLSKVIMVGGSHNPIKRTLGTLLQFAITNVVSKNSDKIVESGENILHKIFNHKNDERHWFEK